MTKTVKLYCIWHVLYLPLAIYHFCQNHYSVIKSILVTLRAFFLVGSNFYSDILWYMLATIFVLIFLCILLKFRLRFSQVILSCGFVAFVGLGIGLLLRYEAPLPSGLQTLRQILAFTIVDARIFKGFLYIPLGMLIARTKPSLSAGVLLLIAGFWGNYRFDGDLGKVFLTIQAVGTFITVSRISLPSAPVYALLRKSSSHLYFLHQYVMFLYCYLTGAFRQGIDVFLVTLTVSALLSGIWLFYQQRLFKRT